MAAAQEIILIHYDEICLKGKNRGLFERALAENVKRALASNVCGLKLQHGRMLALLADGADLAEVKRRLSLLPGIANFSFASTAPLDVEKIESAALELLAKNKPSTFRVTTSRPNKRFSLTSHELDCRLGDAVCNRRGWKVDLHEPGVTLHAEICEKQAYLYLEKNAGVGGLPVGSGGGLVCSLSGGIDSPVAAFMMMKRGCGITFAHAFNRSVESTSVKGKLSGIVERLTDVQLSSKLYIVPFEKLQREIITLVPSRLRMILYRRAMMRIMNGVAEKERCLGIVTGDSVGQVASQTLENLVCIYDAARMPVYAPLAGMNKNETIAIARKIGTYDHSILPAADCCSFMIASSPETRGNLAVVQAAESRIPVEELAAEAVGKAEVLEFGGARNH